MTKFKIKFHLLFVLLLFVAPLKAQTHLYKEVYVFTNSTKDIEKIANQVGLDHIKADKNGFQAVLRADEYEAIVALGFETKVLIEDMQTHYLQNIANQTASTSASLKSDACSLVNPVDSITTPEDFALGSMGGFFTYEQMLWHLDNMATKYPHLITARAPIGDFLTYENRPIYWLKISDNPTVDESATEKQLLYTSIHHAREPASLAQNIYFMYYLLENYGKIDYVTHIVNTKELFFVPCINPDGYIYNQTTNPSGGGMWRKNRRNNGAGKFGVDLNRNYSYQWGVSGASSDPGSDTYKGTAPFSEPETQAIKYFTETHNFITAMNYHTHGDLLLYPFGYANVPCEDHDFFGQFTQLMVSHNKYINQQSVALYPAAGDSDDWMYADVSTKPKVFAMTPEVGDAFWIPASTIIYTCKENVWQNIALPLMLDGYVSLKETNPLSMVNTLAFELPLEATLFSFNEAMPVSISFSSTSPYVLSLSEVITFETLTAFIDTEFSMACTLNELIPSGTWIDFDVHINCAGLTFKQTISKRYFSLESITYAFQDDFSSLGKWEKTGAWGISTLDFVSEPSSLADSPSGNYANNVNNIRCTTLESISLIDKEAAYLRYKAKWNIEYGYDYVQVWALEGTTLTPLCGKFSRTRSDGKIVYDGIQDTWVQEEIDLQDFIGKEIKIRFTFYSDGWVNADGIYLDDLEVIAISSEEPTAPIITFLNPSNGATAVGSDATLEATFNKVIFLTETAQIALFDAETSTSQAISYALVGLNKVQIVPETPMTEGMTYFVTIDNNSLVDVSGLYFEGLGETDWRFEIDKQGVSALSAKDLQACYVFPNPSSAAVQVFLGDWAQGKQGDLQVSDALGRTVFQQKAVDLTSQLSIDLAHLSSGFYVLSLQIGQRSIKLPLQRQ